MPSTTSISTHWLRGKSNFRFDKTHGELSRNAAFTNQEAVEHDYEDEEDDDE